MNRKKELKEVKKIIKENYNNADCGLYDTRNLVGDYMCTIFEGEYFILDICYNYSYFEIFGTTGDEFNELIKFYEQLKSKGE